MKTIKDTGPMLIGVFTNQTKPEIKPDHVRVVMARYQVYEYSKQEMMKLEGSFNVHDANCEEAKLIAELVKL